METFKLPIVIKEEKLSNGKSIYVAHCDMVNVTSQGKTFEEAKKNLFEAVGAVLEECPELLKELAGTSEPIYTVLEVSANVQTAHSFR